MPAMSASRHFALQVLDKAVREVVYRAWATGWFRAGCTAMRTIVLDQVFLRVAAKRSPTCVTNPHGFQRSTAHRRHSQCRPSCEPLAALDGGRALWGARLFSQTGQLIRVRVFTRSATARGWNPRHTAGSRTRTCLEGSRFSYTKIGNSRYNGLIRGIKCL